MNAFKDKTPMLRDTSAEDSSICAPVSATPTSQPISERPVMTALTLDDRRAYSSWPRYDAMDVRNLHRPRFGHSY